MPYVKVQMDVLIDTNAPKTLQKFLKKDKTAQGLGRNIANLIHEDFREEGYEVGSVAITVGQPELVPE